MLQGHATKNGTGITIQGYYIDLKFLYGVVHSLAGSYDHIEPEQNGANLLLLNFAYDVRKAYSGQRLMIKVKNSVGAKSSEYFGLQLVWTDILFITRCLNEISTKRRLGKLSEACLYMLEKVIENALVEYDPIGAKKIIYFLNNDFTTKN